MPGKAPKMTNLLIEETSGVDYPAHLHEGWLVVKASNAATVAEVERSLPEPMEASMSDTTEEIVEQEPVIAAYSDEEQDKGEHDEEQDKGEHDEDELAMAHAKIAELEARLAEMEAAMNDEEMEEAADDLVALAKSAPEPLRKAIEQMQKAKDEAETALRKEREDRADAEAITKATDTFKHLNIDPAKIGPALRRLALADDQLAKAVEDALLAADAQSESADIFSEFGKAAVMSGDAVQKMTSLAKAAVAEGKAATIEQALAQVALDNPSLYTDYLTEKGA